MTVDYHMPETTYHAQPGLSYSGAKVLLDCPARYDHERRHPRQPTPDMIVGRCVHAEVLEDKRIWDVCPPKNTKAGKEKAAEIAAAGLIELTESEAAKVRGTVAALRAHEGVQRLLRVGSPEVSLSWPDEETGIPLRARLDWLRPGWAIDLKTCPSADPDDIRRDIRSYRYDIQRVVYPQGALACDLDVDRMVFIFAEKTPPHLITIVNIGEEWLPGAYADWRHAIDTWVACTQANNWPAYTDDIVTIDPPRWLTRQETYA